MRNWQLPVEEVLYVASPQSGNIPRGIGIGGVEIKFQYINWYFGCKEKIQNILVIHCITSLYLSLQDETVTVFLFTLNFILSNPSNVGPYDKLWFMPAYIFFSDTLGDPICVRWLRFLGKSDCRGT